ncbi:hypothetical protein DAPPUDRAFT_321338 [Daphnia pulex]|uniref:Ionotropic glutamate receptor C-terminal domain-containing protein n=1 Tax=Daphnia pulex TaxID=6669 RepID=E9GSL5_DAPPU|nr:hypothetical protein DAPPUDRAFT_321338 [Daphnia pulex]|eukprot:EFX77449.1 hypothetical protein DAPPUDRAFT_321338 [Daphnia pulex]
MKGKHLFVTTALPFPVVLILKTNSSGHVLSVDGTSLHMLNWLSSRYDFSYSFQTFEGTKNSPGYDTCLENRQCDIVVGAYAMTAARLVTAELVPGVFYSSVASVIAMPESMNNVAAVVKPFQLWVWIGIICVIPCVLFFLFCLQRWYPTLYNGEVEFGQTKENSELSSSFGFTAILFYVFGVLLNQGASCPDKRLVVRMVAAVWCLAALVLVNGYNSVLISYVTSPNAEPLIQSIKDLGHTSDIHVVVDAGLGIDYILSNAKGGIFKEMGDKIRSYPKSRCPKPEECVDLVKSGNHAYIAITIAALVLIKRDFISTGKCDLTLAKEKESAPSLAWVLPKHSPLREDVTKGVMEMLDYGLLDIWAQRYQADVRKCQDKADKMMQLKPSSDGPPQYRCGVNEIITALISEE